MPTISSGDFFEGLKRLDTKTGAATFFRGSQRVKSFPSSLNVDVAIGVSPCTESANKRATLEGIREFAKLLLLRLDWKHGLVVRPLGESFPFKLVKEAQEYDNPLPSLPALAATRTPLIMWFYWAQIEADDIPLTDHLVLSAIDEHGRVLVRFSFGLDSNSRRLFPH